MKRYLKFTNDDYIVHENKEIKFKKIANFESINFSYGMCELGWLIIREKFGTKLILWQSSDFRDFLVLLEIDFTEFQNSFIDKNLEFKDVFPIQEILSMILGSESNYWAELFTNLLIKEKSFQSNILSVFDNYKINKWASQRLKHNVLKIRSIINNQKKTDGSDM
ncbi:hypothetical protein [Flavobacterium gyeonganense]|uniref:Uncharacterized protein n=1 Tax=Flavobacterium gyeonganense TaxID=1310418 RepID=A0ABV5H9F3_9FLAO|nr:hypothetical protein [Flavobacterium gyeonganense]